MPKPSTVLLNGVRYSHSSYRIRIHGILFNGVKEASWSVKTEPAKVQGTAREAIAETAGTVSYEASMTVYRAEWDYLQEVALQQYGRPIMDLPGDVVISYSERNQASKTVQIRINGFSEATTTTSAGTDATEVSLVLRVMFIKENGRSLVADSIF